MSLVQTTLAHAVTYKGIGLHSGEPVVMTLKPAPADTGIVFVRTDIPGQPQIKAHISNVTNTLRATTIESGGAKVFTVEHVLSTLYSLEIDNCYVELDNIEPPVADGSGAVFMDMIAEAGVVSLGKERYVHTVREVHAVYDNDRFVMVVPYDGLRITFTSINSHPLLGTQYADYEITPQVFREEISRARTIGFMHEIEELQKMGLAKGGSIENAIVYDHEKCLSVPRFPDELVRHKILDLLGDISLVGSIRGHIIAVKSSHELNARLSRELISEIEGGLK